MRGHRLRVTLGVALAPGDFGGWGAGVWLPGSLGLGCSGFGSSETGSPKSAWAPRPPRGVFKEDQPQEETAEGGGAGEGCLLPGMRLSASVAQIHEGEGQEGIRHRETQVRVDVPLRTDARCGGLLCEAEGPSQSEGCGERALRDQGEEFCSWS